MKTIEVYENKNNATGKYNNLEELIVSDEKQLIKNEYINEKIKTSIGIVGFGVVTVVTGVLSLNPLIFLTGGIISTLGSLGIVKNVIDKKKDWHKSLSSSNNYADRAIFNDDEIKTKKIFLTSKTTTTLCNAFTGLQIGGIGVIMVNPAISLLAGAILLKNYAKVLKNDKERYLLDWYEKNIDTFNEYAKKDVDCVRGDSGFSYFYGYNTIDTRRVVLTDYKELKVMKKNVEHMMNVDIIINKMKINTSISDQAWLNLYIQNDIIKKDKLPYKYINGDKVDEKVLYRLNKKSLKKIKRVVDSYEKQS